MNEPPSLPSALGIEAVEWLGHGADTLTVRVRGRWRRGRPTWSGQPLLVLEVGGTRHRYPAMPEPPSLTGAAPGTWQMSFAVPASVAAREAARAWLQIGSAVIPLPVRVDSGHPPAADEETLALRRVRAAELAAEAAARRVAEAQAEVQTLEGRVQELEDQLGQARALLAARARAARVLEQREHAERALRQELEERLAQLGAGDADDAVDQRDVRIAELEHELAELRRGIDEAEQVVRAARAARRRAEERIQELSAPRRVPSDRLTVAREFRTAAAATQVGAPESLSFARQALDSEHVAFERSVRRARSGDGVQAATVAALQRELEARTRSEAELRALAVATPEAAAEHPAPQGGLPSVLAALREEFHHLQGALKAERAARLEAELKVARAYDVVQEVREELGRLRGVPTGPPPRPAGAVEADRLSAALARLRASSPPRADVTAETQAKAGWLERPLRSLARSAPDAAERLLAELLPGSSGEAALARRMLSAGRFRGRIRRGGARLRRRGRVAAALDTLLRRPISFAALELDPRSVLDLAGAMIEPELGDVEPFTIAYAGGLFLQVVSASRPLVSDSASGPVTATIACESRVLAAALAGARGDDISISGDERALALLREWLERAQSG